MQTKQQNLKNLKEQTFATDAEFNRHKQVTELEIKEERFDTKKDITLMITIGMIMYPILCALLGFFDLHKVASLLVDMAPIYFASSAGIISIFFGADALEKR